jgi:alpha-1,6-mannosyltransferase
LAASSLHRYINVLGAAAAVAYSAISAMSYLQAPALWDPAFAPHATGFFHALYGTEHVNAIRALFGGPLAVVVSHWIPLIIASLAAVALLFLLSQRSTKIGDTTANLVLKWSVAFAALSSFAYPIFTQDFWLSVVWGDMITAGINPYYEQFTPAMLDGLPLDHFPMTMSYGPLWALISGAIVGLAGGGILVTAVFFKAALAAAWCASLWLIDRIMRLAAPGSRALSLAVAGWVPLGVWQTVGEGHNDIAMALPALLWLLLLLQNKWSAPLALAASAVCKYTMAPLLLIDVLHCLKARRMPLWQYAVRLILPVLFSLAVLGAFYRSPQFFDGVKLISSWHFLQPGDAFAAVNTALGGWLGPLGGLVTAIFPAIAVHQCVMFWKQPDTEQLLRSATAVMAAVSFAAISHLWPWYLIWTLPLVALVPGWWLSRFILGLAIFAPFTVIVWWVPEAEEYKDLAALVMYAGAALWTLLTAPQEDVATETVPNVIRHVDFIRTRGSEPTVDFVRARSSEPAAVSIATSPRRKEMLVKSAVAGDGC